MLNTYTVRKKIRRSNKANWKKSVKRGTRVKTIQVFFLLFLFLKLFRILKIISK